MLSSGIALPATAWLMLLFGTASAVPHRNDHAVALAPRQTEAPANPTDAWVTIDESGRPKTVTPVLTTIDGTPTIISGAPYEVTGTVFTETRADAKITTSTGVSQPQATGSDGSGAFAVCKNTEGDLAPFCEPKNNATIYPGGIHYVTWDPTFFKGNATVRVVGFYNETEEAFSSDMMAAGWGFYQWSVKSDLFSSRGKSGVNITLRMASLPLGSSVKWVPGPTVLITSSPLPLQEPAKPPTGPALYIGLPTILGFVALMIVGTCLWNRHSRRIGLGNIMGRGRNGYGVARNRRQRLFGKGNKEQTIRLMEREVVAGGGEGGANVYRDEPLRGRTRERNVGEVEGGRPRRDSDALGSLAGTPTQDRRFDFPPPKKQGDGDNGAGGNVFRDEMNRQARERF